MKNKRGISPLIATVLVIGFTIALALVIFTWGKTFTQTLTEGTGEKAEQQLSCLEPNLVTFEISEPCYLGDTVEFTLENKGEVTIDKATIRIRGEEAFQADLIEDIDIGLTPLNVGLYTLTFSQAAVGDVVTKVEVLRPIFIENGKEVACVDISEEAKVTLECESVGVL